MTEQLFLAPDSAQNVQGIFQVEERAKETWKEEGEDSIQQLFSISVHSKVFILKFQPFLTTSQF